MKKYLFLFILMFIFISSVNVFAFNISNDKSDASSLLGIKNKKNETFYIKTEIPKNYKIIKKDNKWGVINNIDGSILVPFEYEKISRLGEDTLKVKKDNKWGVITNNNKRVLNIEFDNVYIVGINKDKPKDIIHSIYLGKLKDSFYIATPGRDSEDFFNKVFVKNNEISWLKFYDYPKNGIVVLKNGKKFGFLIAKGKDSWIILPKYDDFYFQDKGTTIFQQFAISYSNPDYLIVKKDGKWGIIKADGSISVDFQYDSIVMLDSTIKEDVNIHDDVIDFKYNNITFPQEDKLIAKKDDKTYVINKKGEILLEKQTAKNDLKYVYNDSSINFLKNLYKENNKIAFVKFYNYPSEGIYVTKNKNKYGLKIVSDKLKTIPNEYQEFKFQDANTGIFKQLGVSYSNPERILAKKNNKWGIINSDNQVVVDFQYNETVGLAAIPQVNSIIKTDGVDIEYKNIEFPQSNLLVVKKDDLYGLKDINGNYVIPLKYESLKSPLVKQIINNVQALSAAKLDKKTGNKVGIKEIIMDRIAGLLLALMFLPSMLAFIAVAPVVVLFFIALFAGGGMC